MKSALQIFVSVTLLAVTFASQLDDIRSQIVASIEIKKPICESMINQMPLTTIQTIMPHMEALTTIAEGNPIQLIFQTLTGMIHEKANKDGAIDQKPKEEAGPEQKPTEEVVSEQKSSQTPETSENAVEAPSAPSIERRENPATPNESSDSEDEATKASPTNEAPAKIPKEVKSLIEGKQYRLRWTGNNVLYLMKSNGVVTVSMNAKIGKTPPPGAKTYPMTEVGNESIKQFLKEATA